MVDREGDRGWGFFFFFHVRVGDTRVVSTFVWNKNWVLVGCGFDTERKGQRAVFDGAPTQNKPVVQMPCVSSLVPPSRPPASPAAAPTHAAVACVPPSLPRRALLAAATLAAAPLLHPHAAVAADPSSFAGRASTAIAAFLRSRQTADGGKRLLTPIKVTRERLLAAADALLAAADVTPTSLSRDGLPPPAAYRPILKQVRSASLACFTADALDGALPLPASLTGTGGGSTCVLQAVARNVATGLPQSERALAQTIVDEADAALRSLSLLDDLLDRATEGDRRAAAAATEGMERALDKVSALEGLVERALFEEFGGEAEAESG